MAYSWPLSSSRTLAQKMKAFSHVQIKQPSHTTAHNCKNKIAPHSFTINKIARGKWLLLDCSLQSEHIIRDIHSMRAIMQHPFYLYKLSCQELISNTIYMEHQEKICLVHSFKMGASIATGEQVLPHMRKLKVCLEK
jgi:hypothetical protein